MDRHRGWFVEFDGHTFTAFVSPPGEPSIGASAIQSICIARDGSVWLGIYLGGVAHIVHGHVSLETTADGKILQIADHLAQGVDGTMWAVANQRLLIHADDHGAWHLESTPPKR